MEEKKDYTTMLSLRLPVSLIESIMAIDWGLTRKQKNRGGLSEATRLAIQEGLQFMKLKKIADDPEKSKELQDKFNSLFFSQNKEKMMETMDPNELEIIIAMATEIKGKKINQLILDF